MEEKDISRYMGGKTNMKDKTVLGVIGVLLTLFGIMFTIPVLLGKDYPIGLPVTGASVIIGVILLAVAVSD